MTDIKMPQLGESIAEATIGQWLVEVGEYVREDQPLVQVTTDKADIDIPSPVSGVLTEILAEAGQTVDVGTLIARIDETASAAAEKKEEKPKPAAKETPAKEAAKAAPPSIEKAAAPVVEKKTAPPAAEKPAPPSKEKPKPKPAAEERPKAPSEKQPIKPPAAIEPQTQETALRADEARVAIPREKPPEEKPPAIMETIVGPLISEEGIPGEEAMPSREPEEKLTPPHEIKPPPEAPCDEEMARFYSPAVMKLAIEHGIDLRNIEGTGECGRITKKDVMDAIKRREEGAPQPPVRPSKPPEAAAAPTAPPAMAARPAAPSAEGFGTYTPPVYEPEEGDAIVPFTRLRRLIADHMVYSKRTSPHVTTFAEADMERVVGLRNKVKDKFKDEVGASLTYLHFLIYAAVRALGDFPVMNSVVQGEDILTKKRVHMGVAVDTERGLFVPVMRNADGMDMKAIVVEVGRLAERVRDRKATPDELKGGTFTVSNPGPRGNLFGTPIISQPQVGILRMGEIVKRPVVVEVDGEDAIVVHPMMYVSLSYDHRVVDGLTANEFLHRVKEYLERGEFPV